jgi:hypothetical protein
MATPIGTLGTIPTVNVGGVIMTVPGLIVLVTAVEGAGGRYGTFRLPGASSGYQVTAGKTLTIYALRFLVQSSAAGDCQFLGQANNDQGIISSTAPVSPIYVGGITPSSSTGNVGNLAIAQTNSELGGIFFPVASGTYAFFDNGAAAFDGTIYAYGYEA